MKLSDFQTATPSTLSLGSFGEIVNKGPTLGETTASLVAGGQALIEGGDEEVYRKTKQDILDPARRESFLEVQKRLRKQLFEDSKQALPSVLADPSIPDEIKRGVITSTITTEKLPPVKTMDLLAEQAAVADSGDETPSAEKARTSAMDGIVEVNRQRRAITSMINSLSVNEDSSVMGTAVDIAEFLAPFAEMLHYRDLEAELGLSENTGTFSSLLTGELKKNVYTALENTPIEGRARVAEHLIGILENNSQIVLPDGNDIAVVQDLQRMLLGGEYSDLERYADNIFSVLDIVGIGSLLKSGVKLTKGAKAAKAKAALQRVEGKLATEADEFIKQQRAAERAKANDLTPLEKEAANFSSKPLSTDSSLAQEAANFKRSEDPMETALAKEAGEFKTSDLATDKKLEEESLAFEGASEPTADTVFREAVKENTRSGVSPSSPSQVVKEVNPELARNLHKIMVGDETGEAAKGLYGTSKAEALSKDLLPEPGLKPGVLPNKVEMSPNPRYAEPEELARTRRASGNLIATDSELLGIQNRIVHGLENATGMKLHANSLVVRANADGTTNFSAMYRPVDSGWATKEEAIEAAKFAFKDVRGLGEGSFKLLQKVGDKWLELTPGTKMTSNMKKAELAKDKQFAIALNWDWSFHPNDWDEVELLTTAKGLVSRAVQTLDNMESQWLATLGQGSVVQNLLDPAAVINPRILGAASVGVDKAFHLRKLMVKLFKPFAHAYASLPKARRALMEDYIKEANLKEIPIDIKDLYARGFTREEIATLEEFRKANDALYYPMNDDLRRSMATQGVKVFTHSATDTKLYGRRVGRISATGVKRLYNPSSGKFLSLDPAKLDELYRDGGSIFKLSDPIKVDGRWVENVVNYNKPSSGYVREFYEGERVLAYNHGYYPVTYNANYFVYKESKEGQDTVKKVIASAETHAEATALKRMYQAGDEEGVYNFRADRKLSDQGNRIFDEGVWNTLSSAGLSAQRFRGERLANGAASVDARNFKHGHLIDPLEAITQQVRSLSQRTAMRPVLEAMKERWMKNYSEYLDLPRNKKTGRVEFPTKANMLRRRDGAPRAMARDARTNFNYIYALENGYINLIDEGYKAVTNAFAQFLGEKGWKGEKLAFKAARMAPTRAIRHATFKFLISGNPLRQVVLQRAQLLILGSYNPSYALSKFTSDMIAIEKARIGMKVSDEQAALFKELEEAGLLESVSAHNWLREESFRIADLSVGQKMVSTAMMPINSMQALGFDAAERSVLAGFWLAARDKALKAGKDIKTQRVKDEVMQEARAWTLNMNRAGDMAYSQNTLSTAMQFFSFRHKFLMQGLTNQNLSLLDKSKLLAYTTVLFGIDTTFLSPIVLALPDSMAPEWRDRFVDGLTHYALNAAFSALTPGQTVLMDWRDFSPTETYGVGSLVLGLLSDPLGRLTVDSPAGGVFWGGDSRIGKVFTTAMKYFNVMDDYEDPELETRMSDVMIAAASMFSGFSQAWKGMYAMRSGMALSASGRVTDDDVNRVEAALMASFGLKTETTASISDVYRAAYGNETRREITDDLEKWYLLLKQHLARRNMSVRERDFGMRVLSEAWRVFGEERPKAVMALADKILKDSVAQNVSIIRDLLRQSGWVEPDELRNRAQELPPGDARDMVFKLLNME